MEILGRVHSIETFGTVDGPGIRYVVFLQGCSLRCKYCHNRDTWSMQAGKEFSAREIIEDLKKYLPFIQSSKGGLTVSGGEPTCQPGFLLELLKLAKAEGIHTALDTSGFVDLKQIDPILDYVDLVLLDIKHIDPASYAQLTGAKLAKTLIFAEHLSMRNIPIWIRYVLVPGLTDDPQDVENLAHYISFMKNVEKVEVLPYHELGVGKWKELGYKYPLAGFRSATQEDVKKAVDIFKQYGINTSIKAA